MSLSTPIARVRGLGAAREGVEHFKWVRITAIGNVALALWFVWSMVSLSGADHAALTAWLGGTVNATLMVLLVVSTFAHAKMGCQVIIEDYVHHIGMKVASLTVLNLAVYAFATAAVVAILKVALSG
ncbi:MAG: succinate dehydrogenase, hydrophobic membrane anchor protein [Geminicoccaceae bacterium]|nr:MAG: succinate dehydrogenase, hydrophobic membrane anchor protein [Geminicoccaceae bacterium]